MKQKTRVFAANQTIGIQMSDVGMNRGIGPSGPPKKRVTTTADMVTVFMNSARKNRAKRMDEYSVLKPPTSSLSASTRSKGGRLSSAVIEMRNRKKGTNPSRITFQSQKPWAWLPTMVRVDSERAVRTTATTLSPSAASYEIIWADARTEPSSGYLEPDDQ